MDLEQQEFLNEICWIVQQRNVWAKRRQHYRNKYRHFSKMTADDQSNLDAKYEAVNAERFERNKFTKRLRFLLKQINAHLVNDSNAGYHAIRIEKKDQPLHDVNRREIASRALTYEADLAISSMLK